MLKPINEQQFPVKIQPEYFFHTPPVSKCLYHPLKLRHFCHQPDCLLPLCDDCLDNHPREHSKYVESLEDCLSHVYRHYAKQANDIATHNRLDILGLRKKLHKMIDRLVDDVLEKADNTYEEDLIREWQQIIKKLEKLKDNQQFIQQLIYYHTELNTQYKGPGLYYDNKLIELNHQAYDQVKYHLNHLFKVRLDDGDHYFSVSDREKKRKLKHKQRWRDTSIYTSSKSQPFIISNYQQSPIRHIQPVVQPVIVQEPPRQATVMQQDIPKSMVQPIIYDGQRPQQQPIVVYQESPIKFLQAQPSQQIIYQQPQLIKTPQTINSIYSGNTPVQPFLQNSQVQNNYLLYQNDYSHPYSIENRQRQQQQQQQLQ